MPDLSLEYLPAPPDATDLGEGLNNLLEAKSLAPSWQRYDPRSLVLLRGMAGMRALKASEVKEWSEEVASETFVQDNILGLFVDEQDLIRNGDTVLMVMPQASRDRLMEYDRLRRNKQQAAVGEPGLQHLVEQLESLGIQVPKHQAPDQVKVHGYRTAAEAAKAGVKRKGRVT